VDRSSRSIRRRDPGRSSESRLDSCHDIHGDHLAPGIISKLKKSGGGGTRIIAPSAVAKTLTEATVMKQWRLTDDWPVED